MSTTEYKLLKIKTFVLKVHMNCQGCMNRVKKVLRKIEGVYKVDINAEEQKVTVVCRVNPTTLIQKLAKHGKHAELCNTGYNEEQLNHVRDKNMNQYEIKDSSDYENQSMIPNFMGGRAVESDGTYDEPESFQEYGDTDYSSLGSREWAQNQLVMTPISEYGDQTPMALHGYLNNYHYHPSNMMHFYYYNNLPSWN